MAKYFTIDVSPLKAKLAAVVAAKRMVARSGADAAVEQVGRAFRTEGAHYGEAWAPRSKRTDQRIGAVSKGAAAARAKAKKFRREAVEQDYASVWLEGKKKASARAKAAKAAAKAKEWRGKARKAAADAVAKRPILRDTGTLMKSFFVQDGGGDSFAVATPVRYAKYHEAGTSKMPARPVMPFDADGEPRSPAVESAVRREMEARIRQLLGK